MEADSEYQELKDPERINDLLTISVIVLSLAFFFVANEALRYISQRCVTLAKLSEWWWRNLAVSWLHADLCAAGCLYCYLEYGQHVHSLSDLLDLQPSGAYILVAFSTGYFLYDMLDHGREGKLLVKWEVNSHHVAVIYIFLYNLLGHFCVSFSVLALMVEVNSVFLHGRKLLQMLQVPFSHWFYRTIVVLNLASFALFRGVPLVLIWAGLLCNLHRYSLTYSLSLGLVMVFMIILNPILFWRLLKSDVLGKKKKSATGSQAEVHKGEKSHEAAHQNGAGFACDAHRVGTDGAISRKNVNTIWNTR